MARQFQIHVRRSPEFTTSFRKLAEHSKRAPAEQVNRKAYFIERRALWHTAKADVAKIKHELGASEAHNLVVNKSGKRKGMFSRASKHRTFVFSKTSTGKEGRFARIVIAMFRKAGRAIPAAEQFAAYLVRAFKARLRSVAFLKSGWIAGRDALKNWCVANGVPIGKAGLPSQGGTGVGEPKQIGVKKGGASPARFNWFARATFHNSAAAKHSTREGLRKFAEPALARAFAEETQDNIQELERRLRQKAQLAGVKTN